MLGSLAGDAGVPLVQARWEVGGVGWLLAPGQRELTLKAQLILHSWFDRLWGRGVKLFGLFWGRKATGVFLGQVLVVPGRCWLLSDEVGQILPCPGTSI